MNNDDDSGSKGPKDAEDRAPDAEDRAPDGDDAAATTKEHADRIISLALKHAEFAIRSMQQGCEGMMRQMGSQIVELYRQNNKMAAEQYKVLDLQQELMDRQAERELAVREQEAKEKRKKDIFEKARVLLPILIEKMMGKSGESGPLYDEILRGFVESLRQEQIKAILGHLDDAQRAAFFRIYIAVQEHIKPAGKDAVAAEPVAPATPHSPESETPSSSVHPLLRALLTAFGDKVTSEKAHTLADMLPEEERDAFLKAYAEKVDAASPTSKRFEAIFAVFGDELRDPETAMRLVKLLPEELQEEFIAALRDFQKKRAA